MTYYSTCIHDLLLHVHIWSTTPCVYMIYCPMCTQNLFLHMHTWSIPPHAHMIYSLTCKHDLFPYVHTWSLLSCAHMIYSPICTHDLLSHVHMWFIPLSQPCYALNEVSRAFILETFSPLHQGWDHGGIREWLDPHEWVGVLVLEVDLLFSALSCPSSHMTIAFYLVTQDKRHNIRPCSRTVTKYISVLYQFSSLWAVLNLG